MDASHQELASLAAAAISGTPLFASLNVKVPEPMAMAETCELDQGTALNTGPRVA